MTEGCSVLLPYFETGSREITLLTGLSSMFVFDIQIIRLFLAKVVDTLGPFARNKNSDKDPSECETAKKVADDITAELCLEYKKDFLAEDRHGCGMTTKTERYGHKMCANVFRFLSMWTGFKWGRGVLTSSSCSPSKIFF